MRAACLPLLLLLLLAACGDEAPAPDVGSVADEALTPAVALAAVRAAAEGGAFDSDVRAQLRDWPLDAAAFAAAEETRVALTWRIRLHLQAGDVGSARTDLAVLLDRFEEGGLSPEGRALSPEILRLGLFDEAIAAARAAVSGHRPDRVRAERMLGHAETMLDEADGDHPEEQGVLERARAWVALASRDALARRLGVPLSGGAGPRVVVVADDFQLGDVVFPAVLERWARDGAEAGLVVELVPIVTGQVRMGIRRVPAESREAELEAIRAKAARHGLTIPAGAQRGVDPERLAGLGLRAQDAVIAVVHEGGAILGRLGGTNLDPRALDDVVQRVLSR